MADELLARVGERVRARREALGLTQRELSARAGLSLRFLAQVERGSGNISLRRFTELAQALGLRPAELLAEGEGARPRHVALLGLRGAGKSTIGRRLAERMEAPFVELDQWIEEAAGLSLAEIFELHGEEYYRRLEREALGRFFAENAGRAAVLATGGSIVTDPESFRLLKENAVTVWLEARPEDHWNRVIQQGDQRPMAQNPHAFAELRDLLRTRGPLYATAHHRVNTSGVEVDAVVDRVAALLVR